MSDTTKSPDGAQHSSNEMIQGDRYLSFSLGQEDYAIPLLEVREVIAITETTNVPYAPPHFLGIMNLRGQVISVIDLRKKFAIKPKETSETAIIICDLGAVSLGVVVDSVNAVLLANASEISERPEIDNTKRTEFITGVYRKDNKLILLLDIAKALSLEDQKAISQNAAAKKAS